jgi:hypothetical protein
MTSIATRQSVLAIKVESTEGTPVAPSGATDFLACQDDFTMEPAIEQLDNAELKSSIGKAKTITGVENPTSSFSHYLRHSGVEGTAPNYSMLLKGAFGNSDTEATEYDTVSGSTVTAAKVNTGEGAQYRRGQALLVKHAAHAWEIRPVHSIATDDLTVGFDFANAPATSTNLGKATTFYPADSGHQSLTVWHYIGNGGAVQMMAGAKVTEVAMTFETGQMINASYSLEGLGYYFDPMILASTDTYLDFTDDNGTFAAVVTAGTYKTPHEVASALQTAMNTADPLETFTVVYNDSNGKFTIATSTSTVLSLLWNTGTNKANTIGDKLGYTLTSDDTSATTYTSDTALSLSAPYTPTYDSTDPLVAKNNQVMVGDHDDYACFDASSVTVTLSDTRRAIESVCAESGRSGSIVNAREVTIAITALLPQYCADKFERMRNNTETRFAYIFGTKSGGNWVAGKCGCLYVPTATISSYTPFSDADGLVEASLELKAYVNDSGEGEVYLSLI